MGAVWLRFRAELRMRWRAWLGLALLVGFAGGAVLTLVAGARRTDSAYPRFLREQRAGFPLGCASHTPASKCKTADLVRVPGVVGVASALLVGPGGVVVRTADGRLVSFDPNDPNHTGPGELTVIAGLGDRFGRVVQREKILEGRSARPGRVDEATINFAIAESVGIKVGDRLRMKFALRDHGNIPDDVASALHTWTQTVRIVGTEVAPLEVPPPSGQWEAGIHLTPAFAQRAGTRDLVGQPELIVALRAGTNLHRFARALARTTSFQFDAQQSSRFVGNVEGGISPQVVALWIVAALAVLAGFVVLGAALARLGFVEAADVPMLRALGMARRELWALGALRGMVIGAAAAGVAVVVTLLASPLMPIGQARILEPSPGWDVDAPVLLVGAFATVAFVTLLGTAASWRAVEGADRIMRGDERASRVRPSIVDPIVRRLRVSPAAATGAHMALDPGAGASAVPVRSTISAISVGLAVLVAAIVFSTSLGHLLTTPRVAGWNWTVAVPIPYRDGTADPPVPVVPQATFEQAFSAHPDIRGVASGILFRPFYYEPALELGRAHVGVEVLAFGNGSVGPSVISGRAPASASEILLGPHTLDEIGAEIGDRIRVMTRLPTGGRDRIVVKRLKIVGTGVVPLSGGIARLGRGATLTLEGVQAIRANARPDVLWLRVAPRADPLRVVREIAHSLGLPGRVHRADLLGYRRDSEIARIDSVDDFPLVLAAVMSVMAAGVGAHVLAVGSRRRRRDLSVLATLGFVRSQVRRVVAWQATTLGAVALVLAVPVGVVAGRVSWRLYAEGLGVVPEPTVSWLALGAVIAGVLVVARLIAIVPGIAAARTRPATVLRSE